MITVENYIRPKSIDEALLHLAKRDLRTGVLAGGTELLARKDSVFDLLVDIQDLGLDQISVAPEAIEIGAFCRIQTLADNLDLPSLIRATAKHEGPNTIRQMGTSGGVIVNADWESELFAALLIYEAKVVWVKKSDSGATQLTNFSREILEGGLVTSIRIAQNGQTSFARVSRTPADKPIVSVVGRRDAQGTIRLAACGVEHRPMLFDLTQISEIDPPGDFRGSSQYRREMLRTLSARVSHDLGG
jgi:putative selenate reductase FAD-binding subunit